MLTWWRRRESNPRPQVLYRQFYILSLANLIFNPGSAGRRADNGRVTLDLAFC